MVAAAVGGGGGGVNPPVIPPVIPPVTPPVTPVTPEAPPVVECPVGVGFVAMAVCTEVEPEVVEPETPPAAQPTEVAGVVIPRTLPRTGTTTLPLLEIGLGLILLGAGALLFGRERTALI